MNKLRVFLAIVCLTVLNVACSSDDNKVEEKREQLVIRSDAENNTVKKGKEVFFSAYTVDGDVLNVYKNHVRYFIDGVETSSYYKFDKLGEYQIVGKSEGVKDSSSIRIKVIEADPENGFEYPFLTVTTVTGMTTFEVDDRIYFDVRNDDGMSITNAELVISDDVLISNPWKPTKSGTFKVVAIKGGYSKSQGLIITVK